ncbi:MAG: hypothetical protein AAF723_05755 [Pseudomonadota bacterium]
MTKDFQKLLGANLLLPLFTELVFIVSRSTSMATAQVITMASVLSLLAINIYYARQYPSLRVFAISMIVVNLICFVFVGEVGLPTAIVPALQIISSVF